MKTNFKTKKESKNDSAPKKPITQTKNLTQKEFEEYVSKSGAAGSFMIF